MVARNDPVADLPLTVRVAPDADPAAWDRVLDRLAEWAVNCALAEVTAEESEAAATHQASAVATETNKDGNAH